MSALDTTLDPRTAALSRRSRLHPMKMLMLIGLGSLVMMFVALTSAYVVRRASGNWLEFSIPTIFYVNTFVIVVSSLTLHAAYRAFKRKALGAYRALLGVTLLLGITFVVLQFVGWQDLAAQGVPLKINPSGDFIYAISWLHAAHVLGGLVALSVTLLVAFLIKQKITPARQLRLELTMIYWHFVDVLWIYLIIFLSVQR